MGKSSSSNGELDLFSFSFAKLLRVAVYLASALMVLSFPVGSAHDFHQHFRIARVRRELVRHTFLSVAKESPAKRARPLRVRPIQLLPVDRQTESESSSNISPSPLVIPTRILLRFRPGPFRAGGEDPLI
jgi:hypothetical protein